MHTRPATHPSPQELAAFAARKLPEDQARLVGRHLGLCPDCRRAVQNPTPSATPAGPVAGAPGLSGAVQAPGPSATALPSLPQTPTPAAAVPAALASHPKFKVLRPLGQGGMGAVFLAEHRVMERPVAIKVVNRALLDQPEALQRFFAEVRAAAKLSHPNIVAAYDAEPAGDLHLLVMEYVEGVNLADYLAQKGPLPVALACHFIRQAALGLQHAHEQGMVHRDVKPQNLMLTRKGQVKILDFGLARLASERGNRGGLTQAGSFMGTPEYVAPEQATDARAADIRADVYSLGCTLYCLLAGRPPFVEDTAVKLVLAHLEKEPPPLRSARLEVPEALAAVVARMLAKEPNQRFQTPGEVATALAPFCKKGPEQPTAVATAVAVPVATAVAAPVATPVPSGTAADFSDLQAAAEPTAAQCAPGWKRRRGRSPAAKLAVAAGVLAVLAAAAVGVYFATRGSHGSAETPVKGPDKEESVPLPIHTLWRGVTTVDDGSAHETQLRVTARKGNRMEGTMEWQRRDTGSVLVLVEGTVENTRVVFDFKQVVRGDGVVFPVRYTGQLARTSLKGTWQGREGNRRGTFSYYLEQAEPRKPADPPRTDPGKPPTTEPREAAVGLLREYRGHEGKVWAVALSPDGSLAASAGGRNLEAGKPAEEADFSIHLWDTKTGKLVRRLSGHTNTVRALAFLPDGKRLLSASWDRTLRCWDAQTAEFFRLVGHQGPLTSVAVSPDGRFAISGASGDPNARLWDLEQSTEKAVFNCGVPGIEAVAVSPAGDEVLAGAQDGTLILWDIISRNEVVSAQPAVCPPGGVAFAPDYRGLVFGCNPFRKEDKNEGNNLRLFPFRGEARTFGGPAAPVKSLAVTRDGKRALTGNGDGTVSYWDLVQMKEIRCFAANHGSPAFVSVALSADGRLGLSGGHDGAVRLWGLPQEKRERPGP
jgi:WD40 repeat protein